MIGPSAPTFRTPILDRLRIWLPSTIRGRILLACLGMSLITGALGFWGSAEIRAVGALGIETYDRPLMAINYSRAAFALFEQLGNPALAGRVYSPDAGSPEDSFLSDLAVAEDRASSPETALRVRNIRKLAQSWLALRRQPASPIHATELALVSNQLRVEFERLVERMADDGYHNRQRTSRISAFANEASLILTILAVLISVMIAIVMSRRIVRPLSSAARIADRIAAGEFDAPIPQGGADEAGALLGSMTVMQRRLGEIMHKEESRRMSAEGRLIAALESSNEAMMLLDRDGIVLIANSRVTKLLNLPAAGVKAGDRFIDSVAHGNAEQARLLRTPGELQLANGVWIKVSREETGEGNAFLIWSDVTPQKHYEQGLRRAAYEDALTGLDNRTRFLERLAELPADGSRAILMLNIDRFRQINNAYGPKIADQALVEVANYLKILAQPSDLCARIGADEFALVVKSPDPAHLEKLVIRLGHAFPMTRVIEERSITISASIGVAGNEPGTKPDDLLRAARAAQDVAKHNGSHIKLFDAPLREESRSRQRIEADLPDAIQRREILLNYQPLVDLKTGLLSGFEALARWKHPELGFIPPNRFIPIAEESRVILDLGKYVLDTAACQARCWSTHRGFDRPLTVAVNLSPRQLADATNATEILNYLDRDLASAKLLKLEVTEGLLLDDPRGMAVLLRQFKDRGVELSLDDFGTGYSSLSYLHKFPFDVLKIDRSFITEITENRDALRLVQTIIELGQDLGLSLVAEGIETPEHARILADLGCDVGQGYFFSRPVETSAASLLLNKRYDWSASAVPARGAA